MATTNEITICNSALTKIGAETILSLDDDSVSGELCKLRYELALDYVTSMHPWRVARKRVILAPDTDAPVFGYDNAFTLPVDYIGLFMVSDSLNGSYTADLDPTSDYKMEGGKLLSNLDSIYLIYVRKLVEADLPLALPTFAEALSSFLAFDLSMKINQSDSSTQLLEERFIRALKKAKTMDARGDSPRALEALEFVNSRVQESFDNSVLRFTT